MNAGKYVKNGLQALTAIKSQCFALINDHRRSVMAWLLFLLEEIKGPI